MGKRFEVTQSIMIHCPLEEVYAFMSDHRNDVHWRKGVSRMELDRPGPVTVGMQTTEVMRFMGRSLITRSEVTEAVLNQKMAFRSVSGPFPVSGYRHVEPNGGGTDLAYHLEGEVDGLFSALSFVLTPVFRRQIAADLKRLKAHLERVTI